MVIKKISLIPLLLIVCCLQAYGHTAVKRPSLQCTGKIAQERQPLFITAETHEQNFINARTQCLQANDCDTSEAFKQARYDVVYSILTLIAHIEDLGKKQDGVCHVCEKTEAKDIKKRLTELLKNSR